MPSLYIYDENEDPVFVGEAGQVFAADQSFMVAFETSSPGYELMVRAKDDRRSRNYTFMLRGASGDVSLYEGKVFSMRGSQGVFTSRIIYDKKL